MALLGSGFDPGVTSVFTAVVITQVLIGLWFRATRPKALPIV